MRFLHNPVFAGFLKPVPRALALGPCSVLRVSHLMGLCACLAVRGSRALLLAPCSLLLAPCSLLLAPCSLLLGPWPLALGPWPLALGPWPLALGPWPLALGLLRVSRGSCLAVRVSRFVSRGSCLAVHAPRRLSEYPLPTGPKKRAGSRAARVYALFYTVGFT
jgi:hypothetical protein